MLSGQPNQFHPLEDAESAKKLRACVGMIGKQISERVNTERNKIVVDELLSRFGTELVHLATEQLDLQQMNHPLAKIVREIAGDRLLTQEPLIELSSNDAADDGADQVRK